MSISKHDVVIVGSGPAGANAAMGLSTSGLDVLMLEKASLPRHKPCGGAMPSTVAQLIDVDISTVVSNRTPIIKAYHNYGDEFQTRTSRDNAPLLVARSQFDLFLIKHAIKRSRGNITLRENTKAVFEGESEHGVRLIANGSEQLLTRYLIAADGAHSRIASAMNLLPNRKFAQSLEAEIITQPDYYKAHADEMIMNLFCLPGGYGWIFPKQSNHFNCGVGSWGRRQNVRRELKAFIEKSIPAHCIHSQDITGHPIPIYQGSDIIASPRVLLAGDAAALVDPVSGEGIRFALQSGKLAANAILRNIENATASLSSAGKQYQKSIDESIGVELGNKLKFAALAFQANPDFFYRNFVKKGNTTYTT